MRPRLRQERPRGDVLVDINVMADLCDLKGRGTQAWTLMMHSFVHATVRTFI